jgi:YebC/PmpR family DNA-binding regulatory protein
VSGHSKWSSIKHKKAATDAKRGQLFTKLAREVSLAAREGGGDPEMNARLRLAVQRARDANMPKDNIERAIQRGAGGGDGEALIEITYEGYGPGGTAVLVEAVTDNRNRTVAEVRNVFTRGGGNMADAGAVAWQFETRGVIVVDAHAHDVDEVQLAAIEAGALDVSADDDIVEVITEREQLEAVRAGLTNAGIEVTGAELAQLPSNVIALDESEAIQALRLLEKLDELDDVARVFSNADFPEEALEAVAAS